MSFEEQRLEELCELVIDCPHSTPKWTDEGFIVLRNQNIRNGVLDLSTPSFTDEDGYKNRIKRAKPKANDIVFTREAPMGEVCLIPEGIECCLGQRQVLLRANSKVDPYYLFWALQSPYVQHQISWNEGTGTTVSNVRIPVLKDLKIPRLGVAESWIAKTMTSLALKSQINKKINQTLEQMAQALFKSWFVDFEPVKAKIAALEAGGSQEDATLAAMTAISGKDADALVVFERESPEKYAELKATAELFPSAMQDSELGEIPEGWEVSDIKSSVSELRRGISPKYTDDADGIMVINQKCIRNHTINFSLSRRHDGKKRSISGRELQVGDVLVNSTGVGTLGRLAPVRYKSEILIADSHVTVVRADTKKITKSFLSELLTKHEKHIESSGSGSTGQTELRRETLEEIKFPCPPVILGRLFDKIINNFNNKISIMEEQMIALSNLRDTLLPKLLSGEITLPEAEQAVSEVENV
ncbi:MULTISPECIES: restriction endonuclease subunit S [Serratia]|uniref:restriction endonuclease subunit S n=1 Tax=Serratia TaxID=613 RepID=UPI0013DD7EEA|nr:restriction endonuclease subunit S [Serratia marcescens]MDX7489329.1 restriction endonuclease subunit S [Serratia marcescens]BEL73546.1 hypothetical protein SM10VA4_45700 [Serratia marcescens]HEJ7026262.1 restriction endonuclease subunit S [Serratia marcescens]